MQRQHYNADDGSYFNYDAKLNTMVFIRNADGDEIFIRNNTLIEFLNHLKEVQDEKCPG